MAISGWRKVSISALLAAGLVFPTLVLNYFGRFEPWGHAPEQRWGPRAEQALYDFVARGGGVVVYHASLQMGAGWADDFERMAGGVLREHCSRRAPIPDFRLHVVADHPPQMMESLTQGTAGFLVPELRPEEREQGVAAYRPRGGLEREVREQRDALWLGSTACEVRPIGVYETDAPKGEELGHDGPSRLLKKD